ncbi:PIN domain-containing protein [Deinococcus metallilatus]|uniref:Ribonuclease VapC n=1 Tax=Deinococcus metallilatus TaxID=1211322 RepID=A0ABR6MUG8_9DEIO|nr:PIN domain-containing protein [Deinococcus metallilatus]MBB5294896.1 PIN domain nuclease of toxin-antitoxin system [Deinococcus metallilatus]GMA16825.1 hypothetical protein GCM10025871_31560 [Deinococcus metallilatus]
MPSPEAGAGRPLLLDASALLAFVRREPGGERVLESLSGGKHPCLVSAVQLVEVEGKLVSDGTSTPEQVARRIGQLGKLLTAVPFSPQAAQAAAFYYARRRPYNLSLGDALCLGTAEMLGADVMTAERAWAAIPDLPVQVQLIR